ncbi:UDP-N-acetylglucosamine 2-epimerase [Salegentibacter salinarum]|uniref:UDP-N-acetylglucosamine 2-epimerase n=1 Tax=Salegentibacter salinarum TaxID=447422 RepID=A0A2N0U2C3_9FLAO|nr:UDP-N-acetylglucosamine 2-epimerase (non-hydrolyzing) [Salegentibacter salinarum]PKD21145.1 UDP-N-acetylglucosamine 2-epimerase [Salegentibacter salinarum]SKB76416.1 UDP-N-acetylglucosamine 2-epimerase (non-hydrolysing) [Salegentibacter salinarum]
MQLDLIAGTRPNFVKIAAIIYAIENYGQNINYRFIHTGQHYDDSLSENIFKDLELPSPHFNLGVGSGSQARQSAAIMLAYEKLLLEEKPDLCMVVGDVTSSMVCAITAKKLNIKIAHVEAGLRSYDWTMPEEVNRVLIDSIADYFFTTTPEASKTLLDAGKDKDHVYFVGNTMIDTLLRFQSKFKAPNIWKEVNLKPQQYLLLTLHRPGNVDEEKQLEITINSILKNSRNLPVIFPVHPRTVVIMKDLSFEADNFYLTNPLGYLEFNYLVQNAKAVLTDSGGITEETTVLSVPCLTLRENTERPETIKLGTNELIGTNPENIAQALHKLFKDNWKQGNIPEYWDGKTGERIIKSLITI